MYGPSLQAALDGPPPYFVLDDETYELQRDRWWPALRSVRDDGKHWALPFLLTVLHPDDGVALLARLSDWQDPLEAVDLDRIAEQLVEQTTGRKWWVACRLAMMLDGSWEYLDGHLLRQGVDLLAWLRSEPSRALNAVMALVTPREEKRREDFLFQLDKPPVHALRQRQTIEADAAAFQDAFESGDL